MKIGKIDITAQRWPWQKGDYRAPLNQNGERFGGGWKYKFGIDIGGSTIIINLIFGMIRIKRNSTL